jgi:outer membrane protein assembly factor BamB
LVRSRKSEEEANIIYIIEWEISLNDKPGYVSPIFIEYAGKKMIINVSMNHAFGVDAENGTILWTQAHEKPDSFAWELIKCVTPLYDNGMIYITGGYDCGDMMLKLGADGNSVTKVWANSILDVHHGGVVKVGGYIYGANWINNGNGNWCCIDWNTGKKNGKTLELQGFHYFSRRHVVYL